MGFESKVKSSLLEKKYYLKYRILLNADTSYCWAEGYAMKWQMPNYDVFCDFPPSSCIQHLANDFLRDFLIFLTVGRVGRALEDVTQTVEYVEGEKGRRGGRKRRRRRGNGMGGGIGEEQIGIDYRFTWRIMAVNLLCYNGFTLFSIYLFRPITCCHHICV